MPSDLKELYKTVWEIKQRTVLDMAAARGIYIDRSQSLNIHMVDATTHDVLHVMGRRILFRFVSFRYD